MSDPSISNPSDKALPLKSSEPRPKRSPLSLRKSLDRQAEELAHLIGRRTTNLFASRQLWCAEAVFSVLNDVLGGGLSSEMALRLSSGLPEGLGGSGCTCGSLNGAALALGLFLGRKKTGFGNGRRVRSATRQLHRLFKAEFGATCCRVLSKNEKRGSESHWLHCAERAGLTSQMAAQLILEQKPHLLKNANWDIVDQRETKLKTRLKQIANTAGAVSAAVMDIKST
jgi:C_GCAxxG_C_C family probable redox protein